MIFAARAFACLCMLLLPTSAFAQAASHGKLHNPDGVHGIYDEVAPSAQSDHFGAGTKAPGIRGRFASQRSDNLDNGGGRMSSDTPADNLRAEQLDSRPSTDARDIAPQHAGVKRRRQLYGCSSANCNAGRYPQPSNCVCTSCAAGRYQSTNSYSGSGCKTCGIGKYQYSTSSVSCRNCPASKHLQGTDPHPRLSALLCINAMRGSTKAQATRALAARRAGTAPPMRTLSVHAPCVPRARSKLAPGAPPATPAQLASTAIPQVQARASCV